MGIECSTDITQETGEEIFYGLDCKVYVDDIGIFSTSWTTRSFTLTLNQFIHKLERNGVMINPLKCEWGRERDGLAWYLAYTG